MTDREKAIVMAYTGVVMLTGNKLKIFYDYLRELIGRPVYTHELVYMQRVISAAAKDDFEKLCKGEDADDGEHKAAESNRND